MTVPFADTSTRHARILSIFSFHLSCPRQQWTRTEALAMSITRRREVFTSQNEPPTCPQVVALPTLPGPHLAARGRSRGELAAELV